MFVHLTSILFFGVHQNSFPCFILFSWLFRQFMVIQKNINGMFGTWKVLVKDKKNTKENDFLMFGLPRKI